jgi:carboxyl-terminal processing protease
MTPISGTPASRAGIQSGDKIVEIDGESTKGITIDDAVNKLRGEPGTDVTITIRRKGEAEPLEYTITREIITIKSVPYYGFIRDKIGYVKLVAFSQDAGDEVEKAIKELIKQGATGLMFDLRFNPGGLLPQAKEVADKFLDRRSLIVSTRGRVRDQNKEFLASDQPVVPDDMPVVVLVNAASASASEIVAGAIQDWDRGIVMGDTTFGKGSVQSILPIDKNHHLKLTTAYYYTPSGRCINKDENGLPHDDDEEEQKAEGADTTARSDSVQSDTVIYHTKGGRVVYGGGGIVPDTIVEDDEISPAARALFLKDAYFKFANAVYPTLKKKNIEIGEDFEMNDEMMKHFKTYLDSIDFTYKTSARSAYEEFKKRAGLVDTLADSVTSRMDFPVWNEQEQTELERITGRLEELLTAESMREIEQSSEEIRRFVSEALLVRELGQDHRVVYHRKLSRDPQVQAALDMLGNTGEYRRLLKPATTKQPSNTPHESDTTPKK